MNMVIFSSLLIFFSCLDTTTILQTLQNNSFLTYYIINFIGL